MGFSRVGLICLFFVGRQVFLRSIRFKILQFRQSKLNTKLLFHFQLYSFLEWSFFWSCILNCVHWRSFMTILVITQRGGMFFRCPWLSSFTIPISIGCTGPFIIKFCIDSLTRLIMCLWIQLRSQLILSIQLKLSLKLRGSSHWFIWFRFINTSCLFFHLSLFSIIWRDIWVWTWCRLELRERFPISGLIRQLIIAITISILTWIMDCTSYSGTK